jgi:hypothetical protein
LIRSLKRSTRNLERALKDVSGAQEPAALGPERASGVRRRLQTVLIVASDDVARTILASRLLVLGFFVESAGDSRAARDKVRRSAPDVVIAEHLADDSLTSIVEGLSGSERPQRPFAVLRLDGSLGGHLCELVLEVMKAIRGRT